MGWNWSASLLTFAWLRQKRLYVASWLYLPVSVPLLLPLWLAVSTRGFDACIAQLSGPHYFAHAFFGVLLVLGYLLPGLLGDRLLRLQEQRGTETGAAVPERGFFGPMALQTVFAMAFMFLIGSSGYGYTGRARTSEMVLAASEMRNRAAEFYKREGRLPKSSAELGGVIPSGNVKDSVVEPDGSIRTFAAFEPATGRSIRLVPMAREGSVEWKCRTVDMPQQCLPLDCRGP